MSLLGVFLRRIATGLVAAWAVLTTVFALFTVTEDWILGARIGGLRWGGADEATIRAAREEYLAERGLDRPLHELYVDWIGDMLLLEWGDSWATGESVFPLVTESVVRTGTYVLPALALGIGIGVLLGVYAALHPDGRLAGIGLGGTYLLFALPNFWIGGILLSYAAADVIGYSALLFDHLLPIVLTATTVTGAYVSYARAHSLEYASEDFVTLVRAKGAGRFRVARHILRNAAIPVVSMLFTEALALLVLAVFVVESVFGIQGFGLLLFEAVQDRDLPVVLGGTLVIIAVGVVGNVVQDVAYAALDPRVDTGAR